jgi:hypothetical protein
VSIIHMRRSVKSFRSVNASQTHGDPDRVSVRYAALPSSAKVQRETGAFLVVVELL